MKPVSALVALMVFFGLSACQPRTLYQTSAPLVLAQNDEQIRQASSLAEQHAFWGGQPIDLSRVSFFNDSNSFARQWLAKPNNRAMAFGHPQRCAYYTSTWNYRSAYRAASEALRHCLNKIKVMQDHMGGDCGCKIGLVNQRILIPLDELVYRKSLPALALVKDQRGRREILGYIETSGRTGRNQSMIFFNEKNTEVCRGTYDVMTEDMRGAGQLSCFGGRIDGKALFKVAGYREGQAYGTALLKGRDTQLILVYGLPSAEFQNRRQELLEGISH